MLAPYNSVVTDRRMTLPGSIEQEIAKQYLSAPFLGFRGRAFARTHRYAGGHPRLTPQQACTPV